MSKAVPMSYESFVKWTAEKVSVDYQKVVLDLKADEVFKGRYAVFHGGKIDPAPPTEMAADLLQRQAAALRSGLA